MEIRLLKSGYKKSEQFYKDFLDDNIKNIKTANELGIQGKKVIPDNFESVVQTLKEYNVL